MRTRLAATIVGDICPALVPHTRTTERRTGQCLFTEGMQDWLKLFPQHHSVAGAPPHTPAPDRAALPAALLSLEAAKGACSKWQLYYYQCLHLLSQRRAFMASKGIVPALQAS